MYFLIVLFVTIIASAVTLFRFPKFTSTLRSKLPRFTASRWFKNPKIKTLLKDREYFNDNVSKFLTGPLFIVLGEDNYKIYDILAVPDSYGVTKSFQQSEEIFDVLEYNKAKFLFVHPKLAIIDKDNKFSSRAKVLVERISKARRFNFIDGILIYPNKEALKKTDSTPSQTIINEINFCTNIFKIFATFFKVRIPLYFIPHRLKSNASAVLKNIFRYDSLSPNNNELHLGFLCDFSKKPVDLKLYDFFQNSMTVFMKAFNEKTIAILNHLNAGLSGISNVNTIYNVQEEDFLLSNNYVSFFLNYFDDYQNIEFSRVAVLNPSLFASYDGSTPQESIKNLFRYLTDYGKDKLVFSTRFLNHRRRVNILFTVWTILFASGGLFTEWKINQYLFNKRMIYTYNGIVTYQKFAAIFNDVLSNKYPFSQPNGLKNASFENVSYVFKEFQDITTGKYAYFFDHIVSLTNRNDVHIFVDDMKNVSDFMHLNKIKKESDPSTFSVGARFDFRVRSEEEYLANRIVNWSLKIGRYDFGSKYGQLKRAEFLWTYGEPLTFGLEFFPKEHKNYDVMLSPKKVSKNLEIQSNAHMYVQGDSVVFAYLSEPWALLKFIQEHNICFREKRPCQDALLQFTIPLENQSNAVFFCDIQMQDFDGKIYALPSFPSVAPVFTKEEQSLRTR